MGSHYRFKSSRKGFKKIIPKAVKNIFIEQENPEGIEFFKFCKEVSEVFKMCNMHCSPQKSHHAPSPAHYNVIHGGSQAEKAERPTKMGPRPTERN